MKSKIERILTYAAIIGLLYGCFDAYRTINDNAHKLESVEGEVKELRDDLKETNYWMMLYMSGKPVVREESENEIN